MYIDEEIRASLRRMIKEVASVSTILATVKTIDEENYTCTLIDDDEVEISNVRLRVVLDGKEGITSFPKQNTWCLAIQIEDEADWLAIAFGEIDKLKIKTGNSSLEITNDGHVIKKGEDTLWSGLKLLIESLEKVIVLQGTNINKGKLAQAKTKIKNVLNGS